MRRASKRGLWAPILTLALAVPLVGCGSGDEPPEQPRQAVSTQEPVAEELPAAAPTEAVTPAQEPVSVVQWWQAVCPQLLEAESVANAAVEPSDSAWYDSYTQAAAAVYLGERARAYEMAAEAVRGGPPIDVPHGDAFLAVHADTMAALAQYAEDKLEQVRAAASLEEAEAVFDTAFAFEDPARTAAVAQGQEHLMALADEVGVDQLRRTMEEWAVVGDNDPVCGGAWQALAAPLG